MKIKLLYFAKLREQVGVDAETLELGQGAWTVADLRAHLRDRGAAWSDALAEGKAVRAAVNQQMAQASTAVPDGAEVAFFPPVTGG
ncbi:molybdenum cofactor biosynthesis protein MoaD [beta proteobacterium AAP99]|nr:molybdenum cofactor biosynthesis protein MoaD [beta proteobacterium AAP99]